MKLIVFLVEKRVLQLQIGHVLVVFILARRFCLSAALVFLELLLEKLDLLLLSFELLFALGCLLLLHLGIGELLSAPANEPLHFLLKQTEHG